MFQTVKKLTTHTSTKKRPSPNAPTPKPQTSLTVPPASATHRKGSAPAALPRQSSGVKSKSGSPKAPHKSASPAVRSVQSQAKRKPASPRTPVDVVHWSESDSDDDEEQDLITTKKPRTEDSRADLGRAIWDLRAPKEGGVFNLAITHGATLTENDKSGKYINAFPAESSVRVVELQYPSHSKPERFQLLGFKDTGKNTGKDQEKDEYDPLDDLIRSVETICAFYFPPEESKRLLGISDDYDTLPTVGYPQRLRRELNREPPEKRSFPEFLRILNEFNGLVRAAMKTTLPSHLKELHSVPLELVERILTQTYARTVSLKVHSLKEYTNGTDNVYGELLPRFVDKILKTTGVNSSHVFADLGSGVGNVVLQAALQTGCEAWGVEMMPNPANLAAEQLREFRARCRLWGIRPGKVTLVKGSFLDDESPINKVFERLDTLMINNFAFQPQTNNALKLKFLGLKEGCQIAHLKPFKAHTKIGQGNVWDVEHILQHERKLEYFSDSVSWGAPSGFWYIATIDRKPLETFMNEMNRRRK